MSWWEQADEHLRADLREDRRMLRAIPREEDDFLAHAKPQHPRYLPGDLTRQVDGWFPE